MGTNLKTNSAFSNAITTIKKEVLPGRQVCDCMAKDHDLIRNCSGCGLIVCQQQGSGPCLFCGTLVVSRQEQDILNSKTKAGEALLRKLTKQDVATGMSMTEALTRAIEFRKQLISADTNNSIRNKVHDLQGDYLSIENNSYLSREEKNEIASRKAELEMAAKKKKSKIMVDLDFTEGGFKQSASHRNETIEFGKDPIILDILKTAHARISNKEIKDENIYEIIPSDNFCPIYDEQYSVAKFETTTKLPNIVSTTQVAPNGPNNVLYAIDGVED
uniref:Zf-C2HC5 domain-containing protein n=1 Tax=Rhabditophanes sp. KR3021 TaxID=114890 RepID=A0AC35U053_9BILA